MGAAVIAALAWFYAPTIFSGSTIVRTLKQSTTDKVQGTNVLTDRGIRDISIVPEPGRVLWIGNVEFENRGTAEWPIRMSDLYLVDARNRVIASRFICTYRVQPQDVSFSLDREGALRIRLDERSKEGLVYTILPGAKVTETLFFSVGEPRTDLKVASR